MDEYDIDEFLRWLEAETDFGDWDAELRVLVREKMLRLMRETEQHRTWEADERDR